MSFKCYRKLVKLIEDLVPEEEALDQLRCEYDDHEIEVAYARLKKGRCKDGDD